MSEEDKREAGSPARGGARTGAGRPKGSGTYSEVRSVRLRPDEAEHCRRKGGNRYLRGLMGYVFLLPAAVRPAAAAVLPALQLG